MGIRGDTFDFITTSPPAIIAKMILYMSEGSLTTDELLNAINEYMNGLDNIIIDNEDVKGGLLVILSVFGFYLVKFIKFQVLFL